MSQVSYGTITITDTNDIERIYVVFAKSNNPDTAPSMDASTWTEDIIQAPGTGDYIWQRTVVKKSGPTSSTNPSYSDPVRLTGEEGNPAKEIIAVETQYGTSANWNTQPVNWTTDVPTYDENNPKYWIRTRLKYEDNTYSDWVSSKDNGLTDAMAIANEALAQSEEALQTAIRVDNLLDGHFIYGSALSQATPGGARVVEQVKEGTTDVSENPGKWHHNVIIGSNGIQLRYNELVMAQLKMDTTNGSALTFYSPSVSTQGNKLMELTGSTLNFYNTSGTLTSSFGNSITLASNGAIITIGSTGSGKANTYIDSNGLQLRVATTAHATLNSNGLTLSKGGIISGSYSSTSTNFLYLSSTDYSGSPTITINGNSSGWRQIIGSKFGVKNDGTLYAANAIISGTITADFGSISSSVLIGSNNKTVGNMLTDITNAATTASKYITSIDNGGIKVHDIDKQNIDYAQIDSNGLTVYQNTGKIAEFGSSIHLGLNEAQVIIGNENGTHQTSHITIDNGGINIYRESDLVMHLGEHTTIGRENKSQLAIENGFLQFSSYVSNSRISQFEIGDVNTKRTTYTPLLTQEIEIGSSYFIEKEDPRTGMEALYEIFCDPEDYDYLDPEPGNPYIHPVNTTINAIDYYYADPIWDSEDAYDWPDNEPVLFASVLKIELGNLGEDFNENDTDLYLGFNGDTIADNYYNNASGMISLRPIRWCLKTERISGEDITFLILPLNFVVLNSSSYRWNPGDTQLTRPNGRFTNMSVMLYKCNNPNNSFSSFKPYLTFGNRTVTENGNNYTVGDYSVTFGKNLINTVDNCFVIGKNNIEPNSGDLFIIGTGSDTSHRANSFKIDGSGYLNVVDGFQIKVNNNQLMTLGTTGIQIGKETGGYASITSTGMDIYAGSSNINLAHFGYDSGINSSGGTSTAPYYTFGTRIDGEAIGNYSIAEGLYLTSSGYGSHAEGYNTVAEGNYSHAEGHSSRAYGYASHAEGSSVAGVKNKANLGNYAHSEGLHTLAKGNYSHAEGQSTQAEGDYSHAQGNYTTAGGTYSHAQGNYTTANGYCETTIGQYNILSNSTAQTSYNTTNSPYILVLGNGTGTNARSNAMTVDWNGVVNAQNVHQIMTAQVGAIVTSLTSTGKKMTLVSSENCSNSLSISSGGIKCAKAGYVLVSGQAQFYNVNNNNVCNVSIHKNSDTVAFSSSRSAGDRITVVMSPRLIQVAADDVLYLYVSNTSSNTGQAGATSSSITDVDRYKNYMTVIYV